MKKDVLKHCIEILMEQLIMEEINLEYVERKRKELGDVDSMEYLSSVAKIKASIDGRVNQIEIAQEMLKKYEKS